MLAISPVGAADSARSLQPKRPDGNGAAGKAAPGFSPVRRPACHETQRGNMLTLYHGRTSVCSIKVRLALAEKGVGFDSRLMTLRGD
jgi:hypothetical protein